jgi:hypothetical protein
MVASDGRLLTTHPYSSDFPFVFLLFVLAPRRPRHGKFLYLPRWSTGKQKRPSGTKPEGLKKA